MGRPQQPELARSAETDLDPDHIETGLQGQKSPATGGETGPVPPDNQPGHHPRKEQDKPDLDAFAAKIGTDPKAPSATAARKPGRPKAPAAKPAASAKIETTPAKRPAAAPGWPESAPAADDLGPLAEPPRAQEPMMVSLALLPLREAVKQLERLERRLTERLTNR